ncbi:hypothetical protein [Kitasatospora purpeofusca]
MKPAPVRSGRGTKHAIVLGAGIGGLPATLLAPAEVRTPFFGTAPSA